MRFRSIPSLSLSLLVFTGCAAGFHTVPESRWQVVATAERDAIEGRNQAALTAALAEEKAARSAVIVAERGLERRAVPPQVVPAPPPDTSDPQWAAELRAKEQQRAEGRVRIERTDRAARRAILAWRRARLDVATARIAVVHAERELERAEAVDRGLPGIESYDLTPYKSQLARAQQRWYEATQRIVIERTQMTIATRDLAAAKNAYAELFHMPEPVAVAAAQRMQLSGFTASVRRRGFKLIDASKLRCRGGRSCFRVSSVDTPYLVVARR